jgi:hypothetical protein
MDLPVVWSKGASVNAHAAIAATVLSLKRGESNLKRGRREVRKEMKYGCPQS